MNPLFEERNELYKTRKEELMKSFKALPRMTMSGPDQHPIWRYDFNDSCVAEIFPLTKNRGILCLILKRGGSTFVNMSPIKIGMSTSINESRYRDAAINRLQFLHDQNTPKMPKLDFLPPFQKNTYNTLQAYANAYFNPIPLDTFIKPRLIPLVIGPSGSGKTHLIRKLAGDMDLTYLRFTLGDWTVQNAKRCSTMQNILDALLKNRRVCLHIDEMDKLSSTLFKDNEYFTAVMNEIFAVLDREVSQCASSEGNAWTAQASEALRKRTFIVCSGTWHNLTNAGRRRSHTLGFEADEPASDPVDWSKTIRDAAIIPHELMNRVAPDFLVLERMKEEDYKATYENCGLAKFFTTTPNFAKMEEEGLNMRALESLVTQRALALASRKESNAPVL